MKVSRMKYDLRKNKVHPDENPLEMMANLMDVILVFACGLMLALIVHWNVDVGGREVVSGQEVTDTELSNSESESQIDENQQYKRMGTVYQDPETGRLYMVTDEE